MKAVLKVMSILCAAFAFYSGLIMADWSLASGLGVFAILLFLGSIKSTVSSPSHSPVNPASTAPVTTTFLADGGSNCGGGDGGGC